MSSKDDTLSLASCNIGPATKVLILRGATKEASVSEPSGSQDLDRIWRAAEAMGSRHAASTSNGMLLLEDQVDSRCPSFFLLSAVFPTRDETSARGRQLGSLLYANQWMPGTEWRSVQVWKGRGQEGAYHGPHTSPEGSSQPEKGECPTLEALLARRLISCASVFFAERFSAGVKGIIAGRARHGHG